ncbi:MAG TPA: SBBP repeat-containing protein, partial [Thermoanaerobaculia bacterium]|nr:SBBP repeat-containing protein [Thermoanaerobaculia bacterium]
MVSLLSFATAYAQIPLSFVENRGQAPSDVLFTAGSVAVKRSEVVVNDALHIRFAGAALPRVRGVEPLPGRASVFLGRDPSRWRTNIATFGAVEYAQLYPGIDLLLHGGDRGLEYDFVVAPGANPKAIGICFNRNLRLDDNGDLIAGELRNVRPFAYQDIGGQRVPVAASYEVRHHKVRFRLGAYDAARPLIIDPVLSYSSYFGGTSDEEENAVAVDSDGNVYFAGSTKSTDIAVTSGVVQPAFGGKGSFGGDVYVVKYDPKTNHIVYTTYLGGSADDNAFGIAIDGAGSAYVVGQTDSHNFPLKSAFQPTFGGLSYEAFITKLSPSGDALVYSSYLGGNGNEQGNGVAVDGAGNAYITGYTFSTNFPATNGFQTSFGGRIFDGFLTKINAAGSAVVYSTFLGGTTYDVGNAVAVDANNNAYVAGYTFSANFPTKAAFQGTIASGTCGSGSSSSNCADAFIAKIDTSQSGAASLIYSTFLGGSKNDYANAIGVTPAGEAIVGGITDSTNFPTVNAAQATIGGYYDAFLAKLNAQGSALVYSTYLGGAGYDEIAALRVDASGRAVVFGTAASADFPTKAAFQSAFGGGSGNALIVRQVAAPVGGSTFALITLMSDAFVAKYDAGGAQSYASYFGGSGDEIGYGLALDSVGNTWVTGSTTSTNLKTVNAVQSALKGGIDLFFARIAGFGVTGIAPTFGPTAGGTRVTLTGEGFQSGATVTFGGIAGTSVSVTS